MVAKVKAQEVAIGSKGNGSVATGPKAKAGKDKVAAFKADKLLGLATLFAAAWKETEEVSASKIQVLIEAANLIHNRDEDIKMFRLALQEAYQAIGKETQTIRVYLADAVRIIKSTYLSVKVTKDKDGKISYHKVKAGEKGTTGLSLIANCTYNEARAVATAIKKVYGKVTRGRPEIKAKPLDAGATINLIDQALAAVRMLAGVPDSKAAMEALQTAKRIIKGVPKTVSSALKSAAQTKQPTLGTLTRKDGRPVVHGSKEWNAMSRGQKAAATRRFHEHQATRVVPSNQAMH